MKLYSYWRSSASFRVRIALQLKGLAYEYVPVHLSQDGGQQHGERYRALNPQGRVPSLEVDGRVLTQSLAIIEWLEDTHPQPALLPQDPWERARVRALAQIVACDIQPLGNLAVLQYLRSRCAQDDVALAGWQKEWIHRGFSALEARLVREPATGRYCHGEEPTLADICLIPQCYNARRVQMDLAAYPAIQRIFSACSEHPAFQRAAPDAQPDAQV